MPHRLVYVPAVFAHGLSLPARVSVLDEGGAPLKLRPIETDRTFDARFHHAAFAQKELIALCEGKLAAAELDAVASDVAKLDLPHELNLLRMNELRRLFLSVTMGICHDPGCSATAFRHGHAYQRMSCISSAFATKDEARGWVVDHRESLDVEECVPRLYGLIKAWPLSDKRRR